MVRQKTIPLEDTALQIVSDFDFNIEKDWYAYVERAESFRRWMPIQFVPLNYGHKHYTLPRVSVPEVSQDWTGPDRVTSTAFTEVEDKMVGIHLDISIPLMTVEVSRRAGMDILEAVRFAILQQMERQIAYIAYNGEGVSGVTGMFSDAGNTSTYTATKWNASTGPTLTIQNMIGLNITDSFDPPYDLILSANLATNAMSLIGTTSRDKEIDAIRDLIGFEEGGRIWWETITPATTDPNTIYPFPAATSNDGVGLLVKADPANFSLLMGQEVTVAFEQDIRRVGAGRMAINGTVYAHLGFKTVQANSICKHVSIDNS
jgi:hypothetical protein